MQLKSSLWLSNWQPVNQPSVRLAIYTALMGRLAVVNQHDSLNWMGSFDSLHLSKIWDCQSFSDLKTVTGSQPKEIRSVTNRSLALSHQASVNQALDLPSIQLFWIAWQLLIDI